MLSSLVEIRSDEESAGGTVPGDEIARKLFRNFAISLFRFYGLVTHSSGAKYSIEPHEYQNFLSTSNH